MQTYIVYSSRVQYVLIWVGQKAKRIIAAFFNIRKNSIKSKGGLLEKISFVLFVGQLALCDIGRSCINTSKLV